MRETRAGRRAVRWVVAAVYTASIFLVAPFVPQLWDLLCKLLTNEGAIRTVNRAVPLVGAIAAVTILLLIRERRVRSYLWLAVVAAGYAYLLTLHCEYPVERVHLVQYSLLAYLVFRALRVDVADRTGYVGAAVAVLVVGTCDELVQIVLPNRSCTFADMVTNWGAGGLGLVGLIALQHNGVWTWYSRRRTVVRVAVAYVAPAVLALWLGGQVWTRFLFPPINVVLITVDCLRPDRMGCYGYDRDPATTPVLDTLAAKGVVFTNMYAQAPWTAPGLVSTLTGLYPAVHGVDMSGKTLPESVDTLLDVFRAHGYSVPDLCYLTVDPKFQNLGAEPVEDINIAELGETRALNEWINQHHREPFCIWYHYRHLHLPYNPPERFRVYPPADDPEAVPPPEIAAVQREVIIPYGTVSFSDESRPWLDALYDAQLRELDVFIDQLRYRLALHHLLKHTLIIVTADHAEELLEHGFVGHGSTAVHSTLYDEVVHIPLVMYCPRRVPKGLVLDVTAQQVDIVPTVCELVGLPVPAGVQGRSLAPAMRAEPFVGEVPAFAETVQGGYQAKEDMKTTWLRSVRTPGWKLIHTTSPAGDRFELYDLGRDPGELRNVFAGNTDVAGELVTQLARWVTENEDARAAIDEREAARVRAESAASASIAQSVEIPQIVAPKDGETLEYDSSQGSVTLRWTGDPNSHYIIEYHIGTGWHTLRGKMPVAGTQQVFGPLPQDGWEPLYQWNPYRVRVRPRDLPDGWSDWVTITIAPVS